MSFTNGIGTPKNTVRSIGGDSNFEPQVFANGGTPQARVGQRPQDSLPSGLARLGPPSSMSWRSNVPGNLGMSAAFGGCDGQSNGGCGGACAQASVDPFPVRRQLQRRLTSGSMSSAAVATRLTEALGTRTTCDNGSWTDVGSLKLFDGGYDTDGPAPGVALELLMDGNARYASGTGCQEAGDIGRSQQNSLLASVLTCSDSRFAVETIFDASVGSVLVTRMCGGVCGSQPEDHAVSSMECSTVMGCPPLILVLGHTDCTEIASAVDHVMLHGVGRDAPEHDDALVAKVVPAVIDAMRAFPRCSRQELIAASTELNVWMALEQLVQTSPLISELMTIGKIEVHGAVYDIESKLVRFMGQHPAAAKFTTQSAAPARLVRPLSLPPDQALSLLAAGNARYVKGLEAARHPTADLRAALVKQGQKPTATVIGCADSRVPIEILFDAQPGDIFVLRNAGNTCTHSEGSMVGSVEFSVCHLGTSLVVVMGHTSCGAVAGAAKARLARNGDTEDPASGARSILESFLRGFDPVIEQAENELKEEGKAITLENLSARAVRVNVFHTMHKLLEYSTEITEAVRSGKVQVHGALYNLGTGEVEFLGQCPQQRDLLDLSSDPHDWILPRVDHYPRPALPAQRNGPDGPSDAISSAAMKTIERLTAGNVRHASVVRGERPQSILVRSVMASSGAPQGSPVSRRADVLVCSGLRMPAEMIFDTATGEMISLRTAAQSVGSKGGVAMASIERAVEAYGVGLVLVLGTSRSAVVHEAVEMAMGVSAPKGHSMEPWMQIVNGLMPPALSAVRQLQKESRRGTDAGRSAELQTLASELSTFDAVEHIIKESAKIRRAAKSGSVEVHGASYEVRTARVTFLGPHPRLPELLA